MTKIDETHQLVRSLNKNEKRIFKLISRVTGGDKNYLKVLNALDDMPVYDNKSLNRRFVSSGLNISYEKNYLQSGILKMLRNTIAEGALLQSVLLLFSEAEVLFSKSLYKISLAKIKKAKELAYRYEFFGLLMDLLNAERRIYMQSNEVKAVEQLREWDKEFSLALEKQNNLYQYIHLNNQLHILGRSQGAMLSKSALLQFKKSVSTSFMKNANKAQSSTALLYYYQHKLSYFTFAGNIKEAVKYSHNLCNHFNSTMLIEKSPQNYISALSNHIIFLTELKKFEEANLWLEKLEKFPESHKLKLHPYITSWKFQKTASHRLNLIVESGHFLEGIKAIEPMKKDMEKYASGFSEYYSLVIKYHFALIWFGAGNFSESIRELQNITASNDSELASDYKRYAKILLLISTYEKGNSDILLYIYKQLKLSSLRGIQKRIVDFILSNPQEKKQFLDFLKLYSKHSEYNSSEQYFNFRIWLDSKIQNISFAQAVKRNL